MDGTNNVGVRLVVIVRDIAQGSGECAQLSKQLRRHLAIEWRGAGFAKRLFFKNGMADQSGDGHARKRGRSLTSAASASLKRTLSVVLRCLFSLPLRAMSFHFHCRIQGRSPWSGSSAETLVHGSVQVEREFSKPWCNGTGIRSSMGFQRESEVFLWSWFRARSP